MTRKIGLAWLTVKELGPADQVSVAAQAGYSHVGLRLVPAVAGQPPLPHFDERETARRMADTGVQVLDVEVFRLSPETRVPEFEPILAAAARLRATDLLVHGADADFQRLVDNFSRLCELAAKYRLNANLEPMPWVEVSTVMKARRVIDAAGHRNAGVLVDAIHFFRANDSFGDLKGAPLHYMQLCDAPKERPSDMDEIIRQARGDRLLPGEGGLDLRGLMRE